MEKTCRRCKNTKPATAEFFYRDTAAKDGFAPTCKNCIISARKQRRAERVEILERAHTAFAYAAEHDMEELTKMLKFIFPKEDFK